MRIIGGDARGRRLKGPRARPGRGRPDPTRPAGAGTPGAPPEAGGRGPRRGGPPSRGGSGRRPTSDLVRGALFDALGDIREARFLDCFAGFGTVGLEAVSRGAAEATLVELDKGCLRLIRENARRTGLEGRVRVVGGDALREIRRVGRAGRRFDVAFCDPPYDRDLARAALQALAEADCIRPDGLAVIQHSKREALAEEAGALYLVSRRAYGDTLLSFYRCRPAPQVMSQSDTSRRDSPGAAPGPEEFPSANKNRGGDPGGRPPPRGSQGCAGEGPG